MNKEDEEEKNREEEEKHRDIEEKVESEEDSQLLKTSTWCRYTKDLLCELSLGRAWDEQKIPPEAEWLKVVRDSIKSREQMHWRTQCLLKPKLRTYSLLKTRLRREPLLDTNHRSGIPELVKLRGGTNRLRIEKGRWKKEKAEERLCIFCDRKEVEDETHFMLNCKAYEEERKEMWNEYEEITGSKKEQLSTDIEKLKALIGETHQPSEEAEKDSTQYKLYLNLSRTVMEYITLCMRKRRRLEERAESARSLCGGAVYSADPSASAAENI